MIIPGYGPLSGFQANAPELEAYFGARLTAQWRPDPASVTLSGSNVIALADRIGGKVLTNSANYPTIVASSAIFNGKPAISGGIVTRHAKRLYSTDSGILLASPGARVAVFAFNATPSNTTWLWGNADGTGYQSFAVQTNGTMTGAGCNTVLDTTSRLPHLVICNQNGASNAATRTIVVRLDGLVNHTYDYSYATAYAQLGTIALLNTTLASSYGMPADIADFEQFSGSLSQADVGYIVRYFNARYGGINPSIQVVFDGNSLMAAQSTTHTSIVLPNTKARWFCPVASRTTPAVTAAIPASFASRLLPAGRTVVCTTEITNDIVGGASAADCLNHIDTMIAMYKANGATDVVMTTCMARTAISGGLETIRQTINTDLETTWAARGLAKLVNVHTATAIDGQSCPVELLDPTNITYFIDGTHLTTAGYVIWFEQSRQRLVEIGC